MAQFHKDNWQKSMSWIQTLLVPRGEQLSFLVIVDRDKLLSLEYGK